MFWHRKLTLKVRILPFLTTFAQLSARLRNFLGGWLLVLGIKEGLVECATVCVKSVVILTNLPLGSSPQDAPFCYWAHFGGREPPSMRSFTNYVNTILHIIDYQPTLTKLQLTWTRKFFYSLLKCESFEELPQEAPFLLLGTLWWPWASKYGVFHKLRWQNFAH